MADPPPPYPSHLMDTSPTAAAGHDDVDFGSTLLISPQQYQSSTLGGMGMGNSSFLSSPQMQISSVASMNMNMNDAPDVDEDMAHDVDMMEAMLTLTDDFEEEEEELGIKAAMATLTNAKAGMTPTTVTAKPAGVVQGGDNDNRDDEALTSKASSPPAAGKPKPPRYTMASFANTPASRALNQSKETHDDDEEEDDDDDAHDDSSEEDGKSSEEEDIPVAVPVDGTAAEDDGDGASASAVATGVKEDGSKKASQPKDGKATPKKGLKRLASSDASSTSKRPSKKITKGGSTGKGSTTPKGKSSTTTGRCSKAYQGAYRSAAAAHRHRQIHVPPIGSPGLLMLPTAAATASFPKTDMNDESTRKKYLVNDRYLLPSTVFRNSMAAGGYTAEKRDSRNSIPHRGSSTERIVGDMFDCDAGGLYVHFPDLIPAHLWERRLGDPKDERDVRAAVRPEVDDGKGKKEKGSGVSGGGNAEAGCSKSDKKDKKEEENTRKGPKGARSSYIFFTNAQRKLMVNEFPGMRFTEQGVIMGERWRALTPEEKKPYEDMATKDKERYSKEMKEYIESVKKEMQDEKRVKEEEGGGQDNEDKGIKDEGDAKVKEEQKEGGGGDNPKKLEESTSTKKRPITRRANEIKGPRLVDAMILSLSKMLGETVHRKQTLAMNLPNPDTSEQITPEPVVSAEVTPEEVTSSSLDEKASLPPPRRVSPDLTSSELPRFTPSHPPQTYQRPNHPQSQSQSHYAPFSFLDMIPVSLTATYPSDHVEQRRTYARAVRTREEAVIDAQEAKDDAEDAQEKYVAHTEAWERMLEYQKGQVAKREVERKRLREERRRKREMEERDAAERKEKEENGNGNGGQSSKDGNGAQNNEGSVAQNEESNGGTASTEAPDAKMVEVKKATARPSSPPPEDPMECMPPRPQPPGPARVVSIPEIPIPPSPPPVIEIGNSVNDRTLTCSSNSHESGKEADAVESGKEAEAMRVPKLNHKLLQHLDPACFLPTISQGRYFGLLSNRVADPQFNGALAPGIAGTTYGGGTGLATSYVGGGRGAVGLVGGTMGSRSGLWLQRSGSSGVDKGEIKSSGGDKKSSGVEKKERKLSGADKDENKSSVKPIVKLEPKDEAKTVSTKTASSEASPTIALHKIDDASTTPDVAALSAAGPPKDATPAVAHGADKPSPTTTPGSPNTKKHPTPIPNTTATASSPPKETTAPSSTSEEKKPKKKKRKAPAFILATGDRNTSATEIASGTAGPEFPPGWIIKTYRRSGGETIGKTDRFWFSPGRNIRFRAKKHAKSFVEILGEPGVEGDEDKGAEIYRARGLHF